MSNFPNLSFQEGTLVEPFDESELRAFEKWLHASGYDSIRFDAVYLEFLERYHGGSPVQRYFRTERGTQHVLARFLNYLPSGSTNPLEQYNAESIWSAVSDRMGLFLIPFGELFAGDYVCFDHKAKGRPRIVVWFHEESKPGEEPTTEFVADSFEEFLFSLQEEPLQ